MIKKLLSPVILFAMIVPLVYAQASNAGGQRDEVLGYPIGTEMTVEGEYSYGKDEGLLVNKVNDKTVVPPVGILIYNHFPFPRIESGTQCCFRGVVIIVDFGDSPMTQKNGKQVYFKITEVISPENFVIRKE